MFESFDHEVIVRKTIDIVFTFNDERNPLYSDEENGMYIHMTTMWIIEYLLSKYDFTITKTLYQYIKSLLIVKCFEECYSFTCDK